MGLLRILTPLIPGPYVDSTCSEGQVVGRRPNGSIGSLVVRGLASPLVSHTARKSVHVK